MDNKNAKELAPTLTEDSEPYHAETSENTCITAENTSGNTCASSLTVPRTTSLIPGLDSRLWKSKIPTLNGKRILAQTQSRDGAYCKAMIEKYEKKKTESFASESCSSGGDNDSHICTD